MVSTNASEVPWMNILLAESAIIRSVAVINRNNPANGGAFNRIGITSIRIGTNVNPNSNAECKSIDREGIFVCTTSLSGTNVGLTRTAIGNSPDNCYHFSEIRAYTWVPFDQTTRTLSADVMPNASLINSVRIATPLPTYNIGGI